MLTEKRQLEIVRLVNEKKAVTVTELTDLFQASESTVRRDLTSLHQQKKLIKVFGGATAIDPNYITVEKPVDDKYQLYSEEKQAIAQYAARKVGPDDLVYVDAGTTTEFIASFLEEKKAVYITNGIAHARLLARRGFQVYMLEGRIKGTTEAVIGTESVECLQKYNFTIGFFGTNGISTIGYTTPDIEEARTKSAAINHCKNAYVLADSSKFGILTSVTFASLEQAVIITTELKEKQYSSYTKVEEVGA